MVAERRDDGRRGFLPTRTTARHGSARATAFESALANVHVSMPDGLLRIRFNGWSRIGLVFLGK